MKKKWLVKLDRTTEIEHVGVLADSEEEAKLYAANNFLGEVLEAYQIERSVVNQIEYHEILQAALIIRRNIVLARGMATKSIVEDTIMPIFGIDRGIAHDIMNEIEFKNLV